MMYTKYNLLNNLTMSQSAACHLSPVEQPLVTCHLSHILSHLW